MKYLWIFLLAVAFYSCNTDPLKIDVSDIEINTAFYRIDSILYGNKPDVVHDKLQSMYSKHQSFLDVYTENILQLGKVGSPALKKNLQMFLNDTVYSQVGDAIIKRFADFEPIKERFTEGFKHYNYYFPEEDIPAIYAYPSGFNQSLVVADDFIGIGLDKYLGRGCIFYKYLGIPQFKIENMYPMRMVPEAFYALAVTQYPFSDENDNLLANMIHEGKLIYFAEAMLPETPDSVIIGYSQKQLEWCKTKEATMWTYLIENKLLYTSDRLEIRKYINDAPFTNTFTNESPGRTGVWLGWQIIHSFMKNNEEISLIQLMKIDDAQEILSQSGFFPE
ncbi:MAG: hypothetical protein PF486_08085 [Prolixibacteraceae bacterium]|jgi:hypothetical protein|nr:hypothetical protein [Prolixibacteraceae bacterium]